jgi:hypothetical protein
MSVAATCDRAIYTQEAGKAKARALNAITIVRALIWAEHLARKPTVTDIAGALAVLATVASTIAIVGARSRRNSSQRHAFKMWVNRRRSFY